ncbi:MAG: toll/interleukin-1 receptor domain-containing protein [Nitrospiraceae bacterium]
MPEPNSMSATNIVTAGRKELPQKSIIKIQLGRLPATVTVEVTLPGQENPTRYESLPIVDGVVTLPVKLAFLSYAKEDAGFVRHLSKSLLKDGVMTWFDEKDLRPGDKWKLKIDQAMESADYVVVFLSSSSTKKTGYFQKELRRALEQQELRPEGLRYVIPVLIDDCEPPSALREFHWLRLDGDGWYQQLLAAITEP